MMISNYSFIEFKFVAVLISLLIWIVLSALYVFAKYWRKKAGWALFMYGRNARWREEREYAARLALLAGNKEATLLYALACPEKFEKEMPLVPFYRNNVKCVFFDYYYSKRYHNWIAEEQWNFVRDVYLFKEGKDFLETIFLRHLELCILLVS